MSERRKDWKTGITNVSSLFEYMYPKMRSDNRCDILRESGEHPWSDINNQSNWDKNIKKLSGQKHRRVQENSCIASNTNKTWLSNNWKKNDESFCV